jgi:hypothetical protein
MHASYIILRAALPLAVYNGHWKVQSFRDATSFKDPRPCFDTQTHVSLGAPHYDATAADHVNSSSYSFCSTCCGKFVVYNKLCIGLNFPKSGTCCGLGVQQAA